MIKLDGELKLNPITKTAKGDWFADTKAEVATATFSEVPAGYSIEAGSSIITASKELAFMKSNGSWDWGD